MTGNTDGRVVADPGKIQTWLDALTDPDAPGWLHVARGVNGKFTDAGRYQFERWIPEKFECPKDRGEAVKWMAEHAPDDDVYCDPYLTTTPKRAKGNTDGCRVIHSDVDHSFDIYDEVIEAGNGFVVASGSPDHGQVFIPLADAVATDQHERLCRGLSERLGGDCKVSDNDVLRPAGTINHKGRARGGASILVDFVREPQPNAKRIKSHELAAALKVSLSNVIPIRANTTIPKGKAAAHDTEQVNLADHLPVLTSLNKHARYPDGQADLSKDTMRTTGACVDEGFDLPQIRWVIDQRDDLRERLEGRNDDDVLRCFEICQHERQVPPMQLPPPIPLDEAHAIFRKWLGKDYDTDALDAELAVAAVERFEDGSDPVWLLIVSGPGAAKTETAQALLGIGAYMTSSITGEAALLSATPKRERAKDATGGLLRKLGERGVLIIKDVTSILAMNSDARAAVMAALREIYDGHWTREVGSEGGRSIPWSGRIAIVGAVTTAWDTHHAVISSMGDRFVLVRIDSNLARMAGGRQAFKNTGSEKQMREELAAAVGGVIAGMSADPVTLTEEEGEAILAAANLVTLARTGVEYDYKGNVIDAHAPEAPTRLTKQLAQITRGAIAIGMSRPDALKLVIRLARDTMPPLRLAILEDLVNEPDSTPTDVRRRMDKPRATIDRQLQALHYLGLVTLSEVEKKTYSGKPYIEWHYTLNPGIRPHVLRYPAKRLPEKLVDTPSPQKKGHTEPKSEDALRVCTDFSGNGSGRSAIAEFFATATTATVDHAVCGDCGSKLPRSAIKRGFCDDCVHETPNVHCSGCGIKLPTRETRTRGTCFQCHTHTN